LQEKLKKKTKKGRIIFLFYYDFKERKAENLTIDISLASPVFNPEERGIKKV
jgi:hypothetical protein